MSSIWQQSNTRIPSPALCGRITADVAVVGGGMAGILCAYLLKQRGVDCVVLEGGHVGMGVTGCTTAKVTAQHGLIYDKLIRKHGVKKAHEYLSRNLAAVETFRKLCQNIDCHWHDMPAYIYSMRNSDEVVREASALSKLGHTTILSNRVPMPLSIDQAICLPHQGQFNPIMFLDELSRDLVIYENTRVTDVKNRIITTKNGSVLAKNVIICTHFPFINTPGYYFAKMHQSRSYVVALRGAQDVDGMYLEAREDGFSFRNYGEHLLIGGGDHRTGKSGGGQDLLNSFAHMLYPKATITHTWATQDCMSLDSVPYIGKYSAKNPSMYVATGFNKWGMSSSMVAAEMLTNMIVHGENTDESVFNSQRFTPNMQFVKNGWETTSAMLNLSVKRCSHLGCALKYNRGEHTWDCPCHGSRFETDGTLIDNPAMRQCTTIREDFKNE